MTHMVYHILLFNVLDAIRVLDALSFKKMVFVVLGAAVFFALVLTVITYLLIGKKKYTTSIGSALANDINAGIVGLILAFIVVSMYQVNQHAQKAILKETAILVSILNTSEALDNADEIREAVHRYTKAVIQEEWPLMRSGNSNQIWNESGAMIDPFSKKFRNPFYQIIKHSHPKGFIEQNLYNSLLSLLEQLTAARRERIAAADFHLPIQIWRTIILMSMILIWFIIYMNPWEGWHSLVPIIITSVIIALALSLIISLHYPFQGPFAIPSDLYHQGALYFLETS